MLDPSSFAIMGSQLSCCSASKDETTAELEFDDYYDEFPILDGPPSPTPSLSLIGAFLPKVTN